MTKIYRPVRDMQVEVTEEDITIKYSGEGNGLLLSQGSLADAIIDTCIDDYERS